MTRDHTPIAVTSRSFSRHDVLRAELLERYCDVRFNDEGVVLGGASLIEFARGRRKLVTALERVDEGVLAALPELEVISKYGVGTDMLDLLAIARHGIRLGWTPGVNRRSVAELTLAFMLSLLHLVPLTNQELRGGVWKNRQGRELSERVVGIVGCGNVGKELVRLLQPFHCTILANDILDFPEFYAAFGVEPVGLDELLERADVVTLHVPLDDSTRSLLGAARMARLRRTAVLINTARGGLVDEAELESMLLDGRLAGAACDVFAAEPPQESRLLGLPNFLGTPHIGGSSAEAMLAMGRAAIEGLDINELPAVGPQP